MEPSELPVGTTAATSIDEQPPINGIARDDETEASVDDEDQDDEGYF